MKTRIIFILILVSCLSVVGGPLLVQLLSSDPNHRPNEHEPASDIAHQASIGAAGLAFLGIETVPESEPTSLPAHVNDGRFHASLYWPRPSGSSEPTQRLDTAVVTQPPHQTDILPDVDHFTITHLEITQGIQNRDNSVPLIAGKPTVVRAYLQGITQTVTAIQGTLYATHDDGRSWTAVAPDNGPVTAVVEAQFDRRRDDYALRFTLPYTLSNGPLALRVAASDDPAAQPAQSDLISLSFQNSAPLRIGYLSLAYKGETPEPARLERAHTYLQMIYPLAEVEYFPIPFAMPYQGQKSSSKATDYLKRLRALYHFSGWPAANGEPDQLFGWVPTATWGVDGGSDPSWFNNGTSQVAFGADQSMNQVYQMIMAHEIGHNLGRQHPICKHTDSDWPYETYAIHEMGFDFGFYANSPLFIHEETDDFMVGSHCEADIYNNKWISAHNFQKLHDVLTGATPLVNIEKLAGQSVVAANQPGYLVSGRIYTGDHVEMDTIYQITPTQAVFQSGGNDYCLSLVDGRSETLTSHCFTLSLADVARYMPFSPASFSHFLPYDPAAVRLLLTKGTDTLWEQSIAAQLPTVQMVTPSGGELLDGLTEITWTAVDDSLNYIVSYSADGGLNWYHLAMDLAEPRLWVDTAVLPGSSQGLFRVIASDGINTAVATSGPVTLARRPPQPVILLPAGNLEIAVGQTLLLQGYAHDLEDGLLAGSVLTWRSDLSGHLGGGKTLTVSGLPAGSHTISLTATDSDGQISTTAVNVRVGGEG